MTTDTERVVAMIYDHLNEHPFFDFTIRKVLNIKPEADVTENEEYWKARTQLIDETLMGMLILNRSAVQ